MLLAMALLVTAGCAGEQAPVADAGEIDDAAAIQGLEADAGMPAEASPGMPHAPAMPIMAEFGGGMHALAESCSAYSAAELDRMKKEQRDQAIRSGMSAASFDADFARGYADTRARIRKGTPAEREKGCRQLDEMKQFGEDMEKRAEERQRAGQQPD